MNEPTITQPVLFADLVRKPLVATFDQAHASSDGRAVLLRAADQRLQLTSRLARCLPDWRDRAHVTHPGDTLIAVGATAGPTFAYALPDSSVDP